MGTRKPVLVVDDDPDVRKILTFVLETEFAVAAAANGAEALSLLERERSVLMFLDVSMPVLGGVDTLAQARRLIPALRVVMLTAERDLDTARRCLELGACAFVTKPFDPGFVLEEARRLLGEDDGKDEGGRPWRVNA